MTTDPVTTDPVTTVRGQRELKRYLTLATWGLWGTKRQEVRAELEEHVLERADGLMAFGVPPQEALQRALRELGPPERVCAGMNGVYLMPRIIKLSALSALLVTLGMRSLTTGAAQVAVTNQSPNAPGCAKAKNGMKSDANVEVVSQQGDLYCYRFRQPLQGQYYLSLGSLERTLKPLGVKVERQGNQTILTFPDARQPDRLRTSFTRNGDRFASLREVPFNFVESGLPVIVTGWTNPTVQVGKTKFTLGDASSEAPAAMIYEGVLQDIGRALKITTQGSGISGRASADASRRPYFTHSIRVAAPAGSIIGIFSRDERGLPLIDEASVDQNGQVRLYAPREKLRFVNDPKQLTPYLSLGRAQALLVRLTGLVASPGDQQSGKYDIIQPSEATSDGVK